jgi:hypothetical protein
MGYYLFGFMCFDPVVKTFVVGVCSSSTDPFWFSTVPLPQQPLHGGCCLYWSGLFMTESFCHFLLHCATLEIKVRLVYGSFEIIYR